MSYDIVTARFGNASGDAVVLQTSDAGEVHLDLTKPASHPSCNNKAARLSYDEWRAAGNVPAPYIPPGPRDQ